MKETLLLFFSLYLFVDAGMLVKVLAEHHSKYQGKVVLSLNDHSEV